MVQTTQTETKLGKFFDKFKQVGLLERIFGWKALTALSFDAFEEYRNLAQQRESYEARLTALQSEKQEIKQQLDQDSARIRQREEEAGQLRGALDERERLLRDKVHEIERLQTLEQQRLQQIAELQQQNAVLKGELETLRKRLQEREVELGQLETSREKDTQQNLELQKTRAALQGEIENREQKLRENLQTISGLEENNRALQNQILELQKENAGLRGTVENLQKALQEKENANGSLQATEKKQLQRLNELEQQVAIERQNLTALEQQLRDKNTELGRVSESDLKFRQRTVELDKEKALLEQEMGELRRSHNQLKEVLAAHQESDQQKQQQYEHKVSELNALKRQLDDDRLRVQQEREDEIRLNYERMRLTWKTHEELVQNTIMDICTKYSIEYFAPEKVPFKGKPDNTLKIAGEYIIFDAKSPQGEELGSFPKYLKAQAESLKKYMSQDNVKKDVFLVVPSNTAEHIRQTHQNMVDYRVYVVTIDALEPLIANLLKIESYEFAEQLSPEDREQICRIIGKFAHAAKRKIQIDDYLNNQFFSILNECRVLPEDVLSKAIEFERSDKLNPPMERRAKEISMKEIDRHLHALTRGAAAKNISTDGVSQALELVPVETE